MWPSRFDTVELEAQWAFDAAERKMLETLGWRMDLGYWAEGLNAVGAARWIGNQSL